MTIVQARSAEAHTVSEALLTCQCNWRSCSQQGFSWVSALELLRKWRRRMVDPKRRGGCGRRDPECGAAAALPRSAVHAEPANYYNWVFHGFHIELKGSPSYMLCQRSISICGSFLHVFFSPHRGGATAAPHLRRHPPQSFGSRLSMVFGISCTEFECFQLSLEKSPISFVLR